MYVDTRAEKKVRRGIDRVCRRDGNGRPLQTYSPVLGRFLQADPIGYADNSNLYTYVGNDPVNFADSLGLAEGPLQGQDHSDWNSRDCTGTRLCSWSPSGVAQLFAINSGYWAQTGERSTGGICTSDPLQCTDIVATGPSWGWISTPFQLGSFPQSNATRESDHDLQDTIAHKIYCSIKSFNIGIDAAGGFGPVLRGSAGLSYDHHTGRVSWYYSWGAGYGVAFNAGIAGAASNSLPSSGYSSTRNFGTNLVAGGSAQFQSTNNVVVSAGIGPKIGFEASSTENYSNTGYIYTAQPSRC